MTADKYDAIAKDLCAEWKRGQESWGGVWFTEDSLAAALRRVAAEARAEEREALRNAIAGEASAMDPLRERVTKNIFDNACDAVDGARAKEQSNP